MSPSPPLVSVVIPAFNADRYIADAIESVLMQQGVDAECIVVDDGSTDATASVVRRFGDAVRYIRQDNSGVSSARNNGVAASKGPLIAFLDADDVWLPGKLATQATLARDHGQVGLVYTAWQAADENLRPTSGIHWAPPNEAVRNTLLLEPPGIWVSSTALIPRWAFDAVGGFDGRLSTSADSDLAIRLATKYGAVGTDGAFALYRHHPGQMHLNVEAMERDMELVYAKVFADPELPDQLQALRGRAYANLHHTLALSGIRAGQWGAALRHLARAFRHSPGRAARLSVRAAKREVVRLRARR